MYLTTEDARAKRMLAYLVEEAHNYDAKYREEK